MNDDCIFCKVISGELPSTKVFEDDKVLAFLDIRPINLGHTLVIPKEHHEALYDIPDELLSYLAIKVKEISVAIKKATNAGGINIHMNNDKAAFQVIFHSHLHIIPRFDGDGIRPWPGKIYSEGETKEMAKKIKEFVNLMHA